MNNNLIEVANGSIDILKKNLPKVLLVTGIGTGIGAVAASGIASFKASEVIKDIQCDPACDDKKVAFKNYMTRVVPLYIPVAILEAGSIVCLVKSYDINAKRLAAATALAEVSIETFKLYKEKTKRILGEEKVKELEKEIEDDEKRKDEEKRNDPNKLISHPECDVQWFRDSLTGQEFVSTINNITRANLKFVERMSYEMQMSKNEWLDILKDYTFNARDGEYQVSTVPDGDDVGWLYGETVHVYTDKVGKTKLGFPCIILTYSSTPKSGFRDRFNHI